MLQDQLKACRKNKGLTQEELAEKLHVVRQTVSKWECGASVPDADLLLKIAEILEVDVKDLLGGDIEPEENRNELALQLARINEQLAVKNRRSRRILKTIVIVSAALLLFFILLTIFGRITQVEIRTEEVTKELL